MGWFGSGVPLQHCMPSHCPNGVQTCGGAEPPPPNGPKKIATDRPPSTPKAKSKLAFFFSLAGLLSHLTGFNELNRECVGEPLGAIRVVMIRLLFFRIGVPISEKTFGTGEGSQLASAALWPKPE